MVSDRMDFDETDSASDRIDSAGIESEATENHYWSRDRTNLSL